MVARFKKNAHLWVLMYALTFATGYVSEASPDVFSRNAAIGRGLNLGNALDAPHEGAWGVTLETADFQRIATAGFDSVRLPVRWSAHMAGQPPYAIDPKFLARVDWAIQEALERKLTVIVNVHHFEALNSEPAAHKQQFLALWRQLAEHYRDYPPDVYFEILNEPNAELTPDLWNEYLDAAIELVRRSNPNRALVVGPGNWNNFDALEQLKLPADDRNLIVTVHYYSPFHFTHQGASWVGAQSDEWLGTPWPAEPQGQAQISADFAAIKSWAERHDRPIFIGEFGAYEKADLNSRARWTRAIAETAEAQGFAWAYWEYCSGFGLFDKKLERWNPVLMEALRAQLPAPPVPANAKARMEPGSLSAGALQIP